MNFFLFSLCVITSLYVQFHALRERPMHRLQSAERHAASSFFRRLSPPLHLATITCLIEGNVLRLLLSSLLSLNNRRPGSLSTHTHSAHARWTRAFNSSLQLPVPPPTVLASSSKPLAVISRPPCQVFTNPKEVRKVERKPLPAQTPLLVLLIATQAQGHSQVSLLTLQLSLALATRPHRANPPAQRLAAAATVAASQHSAISNPLAAVLEATAEEPVATTTTTTTMQTMTR